MIYQGRQLDPIKLWGEYCDFPPNMDESGPFLQLVQCPNPEHDTLKRHFQVNVQQPKVHCFARCGISGSYEHALCIIHGLYDEFKVFEVDDEREQRERRRRAYRKARKIIFAAARQSSVRRSGTEVSRGKTGTGQKADREREPTSVVPDLSVFSFLPQFATEYLTGRGIHASTIAAWRLGWNSENQRIVIPAFDEDKHLKFIIQRATKPREEPRYLYPDGSGELRKGLLFGACMLDQSLVESEGLILVEGSMDAIKLYELGFRNVGAILGNFVSRRQSRLISRLRPKRIYAFFDKDSGGITALLSLAGSVSKTPISVVRYPRGYTDPAEFNLREEVERAISRAVAVQKVLKSIPEASSRRRFNGTKESSRRPASRYAGRS